MVTEPSTVPPTEGSRGLPSNGTTHVSSAMSSAQTNGRGGQVDTYVKELRAVAALEVGSSFKV